MVSGGGSDDEPGVVQAKVTARADVPVIAPLAPRTDGNDVEALEAEPEEADDGAGGLWLSPPDGANGWDAAVFTAEWTDDEGRPIHGVVDLQRVDDAEWSSVAEVELDGDGGQVEVDVAESGIYRLGYGGSDTLDATVSNEVTVIVGDELLPSRVTATASPADSDMVEVTATWTTEGGVAIVGDLELQRDSDDGWETVTTVTTDAESTAVTEVEADFGDRFRFVYDGGDRFAAVESDEASVDAGDDVRTIPVTDCSTGREIDNLPYGAACHYTPVSSGTFVVAHDYLGNAWWNAMPMGTMVELEGQQGGLYEVVDRVIAEGRGQALGSASNWTCGDECDVILQTCQGANTGFTWLRRVD